MQIEDLDQDHAEIVVQGVYDTPAELEAMYDTPAELETTQNPTQPVAGSDFSTMAEVSASAEKTNKREAVDMAGSLFKNDRKSKDTHPDLTGNAMINGVEYYLSAWRKAGTKGDFYSLSVRPKESAAAKELI